MQSKCKKINSKIVIKKMGIFILSKCKNKFKKLLHTCQEYDACRLSVTLLTDIKLSWDTTSVFSILFCDVDVVANDIVFWNKITFLKENITYRNFHIKKLVDLNYFTWVIPYQANTKTLSNHDFWD